MKVYAIAAGVNVAVMIWASVNAAHVGRKNGSGWWLLYVVALVAGALAGSNIYTAAGGK